MFQGLRRKGRQGPTDLIPAADEQQQGDGVEADGVEAVEADEEVPSPPWYVARPESRRDCPVCVLVQLSIHLSQLELSIEGVIVSCAVEAYTSPEMTEHLLERKTKKQDMLSLAISCSLVFCSERCSASTVSGDVYASHLQDTMMSMIKMLSQQYEDNITWFTI